jgi:uncharacterized protein (UPF0333 family)
MRENVAALVVLALVIGAAIGYFGNTSANGTTTQTVIRTYTITTTFLQGESEVMRCVLTQYAVWKIAHIENSTTSYGNTTETSGLQTYQTTTSVVQIVGYVTTSTSSYTGTITGALAEGNYTICTYVSG